MTGGREGKVRPPSLSLEIDSLSPLMEREENERERRRETSEDEGAERNIPGR